MGKFGRWAIALALGMQVAVVGLSPASHSAVAAQMDYYAPWGVSALATDRLTPNKVYVHDMLRIGDRMYVAGAFENVVKRKYRSQPIKQSFLAAFDAASGAFISSFAPVLDHPAYALKQHPSGALLVGGEFTSVNGAARAGLVALDPLTGATDLSFTTTMFYSTTTRPMVKAITFAGDRIYVGGSFNGARNGSASLTRKNLLRVQFDGTLDPSWTANITGGGVWDLETSTDEQRVFVGGRFNAVNGSYRAGLAMIGVDGVVSPAFSHWSEVGAYCYSGYPGCYLIYDLDVENGQLVVAGAEHFVSVFDDTTGARQWMAPEPHDTQAVLFDGDNVWVSRHGSSGATGLWYARNRHTGATTLSTNAITPSSGEGGFAFAHGVNGCVWFGGTLATLDITAVAGATRVEANHLAFACPSGTPVPG